jgi:hypothetical protein
MIQNADKNICKNRNSITIGNLKAFYKFFETKKVSSTQAPKTGKDHIVTKSTFTPIKDCLHIRQFVEVMEKQSKPSVLFGIITNIFCKGPRNSNIKMIIFATANSIASELRYLEKKLRKFSPEFCPPVYSMPISPNFGERKRVINAFRHGILLLNLTDFKYQHNITGKLG